MIMIAIISISISIVSSQKSVKFTVYYYDRLNWLCAVRIPNVYLIILT